MCFTAAEYGHGPYVDVYMHIAKKEINSSHSYENKCVFAFTRTATPYIFNIQGKNAHWFFSTCENLPWDAHKLVQTSALISFKVDHVYFLGLLLFYGSVRTLLMHNHKKRKRPLGQSTSRNSCLLPSLISEQLQFRVLGRTHGYAGVIGLPDLLRETSGLLLKYMLFFYFLLNSEIQTWLLACFCTE